jgi:hypothetical protein
MATPRSRLMNPAFSEVFHCTSRCRRPPPLYSPRVNAGTRKARNVETPSRAHAALTPASSFGNLPTAGRRIPASAKRLRIHVLGWVSLELGPTPIARNRTHSHRRAPALVSGRPCAGHPIGLILAPAPTLLRPSWRRVYDWPLPLTGPSANAHDRHVRNQAREFRSFRQKSGCLQLSFTGRLPSPNPRLAPLLPSASHCSRPEQLPRLWRQAPQGTSPDEYTSGA